MAMHKAFSILLFLASITIFVEEFRHGAFNIVLLVVTIFWCLATLASLLDSNFFLFRIEGDVQSNSRQIFRIIIIDYAALAVSLTLTEGAFGVYPYALAFLLLYTLIIVNRWHAIISFFCLFFCAGYSFFVRMVGLSSFYGGEVYGRISTEIEFMKNKAFLAAAYPFLQLMLLAGVIYAAYSIRQELHRSLFPARAGH